VPHQWLSQTTTLSDTTPTSSAVKSADGRTMPAPEIGGGGGELKTPVLELLEPVPVAEELCEKKIAVPVRELLGKTVPVAESEAVLMPESEPVPPVAESEAVLMPESEPVPPVAESEAVLMPESEPVPVPVPKPVPVAVPVLEPTPTPPQ